MRRLTALLTTVCALLAGLAWWLSGEPPAGVPPVDLADAPADGTRARSRVALPATGQVFDAPRRTPVGGATAASPRLVPGRRLDLRGLPPREGDLGRVAREVLRDLWDEAGLGSLRGELRLVREFDSLTGRHVRFRQVLGGVPVFGSEVSVHVAPDGRPLLLNVDAYPLRGVADPPRAGISSEEARDTVQAELSADAGGPVETHAPRLSLLPEGAAGRLVWIVDARTPGESVRLFLDAADGEAVRADDLRRAAEGRAMLFDPNPIHSEGDATLRDQGDRDYAALTNARRFVALPRLDGTGFVRGEWADATSTRAAIFDDALDWTWVTRAHDGFEQLMSYYHVDRTQNRLQALGVTLANAESQKIDAHALDSDQSFFDIFADELNFGDGGVDDAEDGDIIVHEYGHSLQFDQVENFGLTGEGGAMGEGFSDFLAVVMHESGRPAWDVLFASWDAVGFNNRTPPHIRRVDRKKVFPQDYVSEVHADGEMWSRLLWDLRQLIGADEALRLVVESHFFMASATRFRGGTNALLVANSVVRDARHEASIQSLIAERGFDWTVPDSALPPEDAFEENDTSDTALDLARGTHERLLLADEDWYRVVVPPFRRLLVRADFDAVALNLDLEAWTADGRRMASSEGLGYVEELSLTAGAAPLVAHVRCFHAEGEAGRPGAYDLTLTETDLEAFGPQQTLVRELEAGATLAFRVAVAAAKVEGGARLKIVSKRKKRGARNTVRILRPDGTEFLDAAVRSSRKGAKVVVFPDQAGDWLVEVLPRDGTAGRYLLKIKLK